VRYLLGYWEVKQMKNKFIYITLLVSIVFHLWAIHFLAARIDIRNNQSEEDHIICSSKMTFFSSSNSSVAEAENELPENFLKPQKEILDTISDISNNKEIPEMQDEPESISQDNNNLEEVGKKMISRIEEENLTINEATKEKDFIKEKKTKQTRKEDEPIQEKNEELLKDKKILNAIEHDLDNKNIDKKFNESKSLPEKQPLDLTQANFSDNNILPPKIVSVFQPTYPKNLRKREIEGKVQLKVLINKEGKTIQVEMHSSSGYQGFDREAVQSVYKWQFEPAKSGNNDRDSWVLIPVIFRLK